MVGGGGELVVRYGTSMVRRVMVIAAVVASCAQKSTRGRYSMVLSLILCSLDRFRGMVDVYNYNIRVVNNLTFIYFEKGLHISQILVLCKQILDVLSHVPITSYSHHVQHTA